MPHPAFFYAAGCFSLCCTGLALILLGFGAHTNPYPDPWEDPKVDSTTPVVRIIETLCGASSYAARFWGLCNPYPHPWEDSRLYHSGGDN